MSGHLQRVDSAGRILLLRQARFPVLLTLSGSRMLRCTRHTISFTVMSMGTLSGIEQVTVSAAGEHQRGIPMCKLRTQSTLRQLQPAPKSQFPTTLREDPSQCYSSQLCQQLLTSFSLSFVCTLACLFPNINLFQTNTNFHTFYQTTED